MQRRLRPRPRRGGSRDSSGTQSVAALRWALLLRWPSLRTKNNAADSLQSLTNTVLWCWHRFRVKKWNAVAVWSWNVLTDTCAICRNNLHEPSIEYQAQVCLRLLRAAYAA